MYANNNLTPRPGGVKLSKWRLGETGVQEAKSRQ